jgi:hypothetical protein
MFTLFVNFDTMYPEIISYYISPTIECDVEELGHKIVYEWVFLGKPFDWMYQCKRLPRGFCVILTTTNGHP